MMILSCNLHVWTNLDYPLSAQLFLPYLYFILTPKIMVDENYKFNKSFYVLILEIKYVNYP